MTTFDPDTTLRARAIVKLAADTAPASVQEWLRRDEFGGWERSACEYLLKLTDPDIQQKLAVRPMTDDEINHEIATAMVRHALRAAIADAKARAAPGWRASCRGGRRGSRSRSPSCASSA